MGSTVGNSCQLPRFHKQTSKKRKKGRADEQMAYNYTQYYLADIQGKSHHRNRRPSSVIMLITVLHVSSGCMHDPWSIDVLLIKNNELR